MKNTQIIPQTMFDNLFQHTVGFDRLHDLLMNPPSQPKFPPYNISRDAKQGKYHITLALAGYDKSNINIVVKENILKVSSDGIHPKKQDDIEILHNGIANRSFRLDIPLDESMDVIDANMKNGILSIHVVTRTIETLVKQIDIT